MEKTKILVLLEKIMIDKQFCEQDVKDLINELVFNNPYAKITYLPKAIVFKDLKSNDVPDDIFVAGQYNPHAKTLEISTTIINYIMSYGLSLEMLCKVLDNIGHELTHIGQFAMLDELVDNPQTTKSVSNRVRDVLEEQDAFRLTRNSADFVNQITKKLVGKSINVKDPRINVNELLMFGSYYNSLIEVDARNGGSNFAESILTAVGNEAKTTHSPIYKYVLSAFMSNLPESVHVLNSGVKSQKAFIALKELVEEISIKQLINLEDEFASGATDLGFNRAGYLDFYKALKFCYNVKLHTLNIDELITHSKNSNKFNLPVYQAAVHEKIKRLLLTHQAENLPATKQYVNDVLKESEQTKSPIFNDHLAELVGSVADLKPLCEYLYNNAPYSCNKSFKRIVTGFSLTRLNVNLKDPLLSHLLITQLKQDAKNFKLNLLTLLQKNYKPVVVKYLVNFYTRSKNLSQMFIIEKLAEPFKSQLEEVLELLNEIENMLKGPVSAPVYNEEKLNQFLRKKK